MARPSQTPFSGDDYTVTCAQDGGASAHCLDTGTLSLLRTPGKHKLVVTVTGFDGAVVTSTLKWAVATPARTLGVTAPASGEAGDKVRVRARKLLPREKYVVRIGGVKVASGKADDKGRVSARVRIPGGLRPGVTQVVVRGATGKRQGRDAMRILRG